MSLMYADCRVLKPAEVGKVLDWIAAPESHPEPSDWVASCLGRAEDTVWILAYCDDGVTWGKVHDHRLALSCEAGGSWGTPKPDRKRLQHLRLFGPGGELLLWRTEGTEPSPHAGRFLGDADNLPEDDPAKPKDDLYLLSADRIAPGASVSNGFTAVQDRGGRTQVVPLTVDEALFEDGQYRLGLEVRHYFELDEVTGCVRIAASRLVQLRQLAADERLIQVEGQE